MDGGGTDMSGGGVAIETTGGNKLRETLEINTGGGTEKSGGGWDISGREGSEELTSGSGVVLTVEFAADNTPLLSEDPLPDGTDGDVEVVVEGAGLAAGVEPVCPAAGVEPDGLAFLFSALYFPIAFRPALRG